MEIAHLGIKVENGQVVQAVTALDKMTVAGGKAEAAIGRVSRRMGLAEIEARKMDAAMDAAGKSSFKLTGGLGGLTGALQAMAGALFVRELIATADAYTSLHARLGLVTTDSANLAAVERALFDVSQQTRTGLESNVALYASLARSTKALGLSQADLVNVTKTVAQSFIVSGASVQETEAAVRQLGQAFASGVLRGDEFNSIAENAPRLQQAVADSLGVTIGQLRQMAKEGQITGAVIAKALLGQGAKIAAEFDAMSMTVGGAMVRIHNAVLKYIGTVDQANGASGSLAEGLSLFAEKIPTILGWIGKLAEAYGFLATAMATVALAAKNMFTGNAGLNASLLANLKAEWEALMRAPTATAAGGGTIGTARGAVAAVVDAAQAAKDAKEAQRILEERRQAEERAEEERRRAQERYVDDIATIWDRGIDDIVASTAQGFQAMLESVSSFMRQLADRMTQEGKSSPGLSRAAAGVGGALAGFAIGSQTTNRGAGVLGGAAAGALAGSAFGPWGAAIGGLAGAAGGLLGASKAQAQAAGVLRAAAEQFRAQAEFYVTGSKGNSVDTQLAEEALRVQELLNTLNQLFYDHAISVAELFQRGNDILAAYGRITDAIKEAAALQKQQFAEDLQVRLLTAQGHTKEADALRLQLAQVREYAEAQKNGADEATLALLAQVQAQEKLAAATNQAASAALNMVQGYKLQAALFQAIGPRDPGSSENPFIPTNPGTRSNSASDTPIVIENIMMLDGQVIARNTKKVFKNDAGRQFGDSTRWADTS